MTEEQGLFWLLILLLVAGFVLIVVAGMLLGRKLTDRAYQRASGVNGINQIQTLINIRTHFFRVQLGLVLVVISMLSLIDSEGILLPWIVRILLCWALISFAVGSVWDWHDEDEIMKMQIAASRARGIRQVPLPEDAPP